MAEAASKAPDRLPRSQRQRLLLRALRRGHHPQLRRLLTRIHPADIAQLVPLLAPGDRQALIQMLFDLRLAARTLRELHPETQRQVLAEIPDPSLAIILSRLSPDDAADLILEIEAERRQRLMELLDRPAAARISNLLRHGEDTAGGIMNPDVISFSGEQTAAETLRTLRKLAEQRRLFYLYVTDDRGHLIGLVNLWQLVTAPAEARLREIMGTDVVAVRVDTPQEEVARVFSRYDLLIVPVLDEDGRLVGAITVDDVLDVLEEEATEDLYRLANLDTQEGIATSAPRSVRLRLPWLLFNLGTAFLAAWVVSLFQETIAKYVLLAAFLPIVAGMGGNAGTQTLTVMVRALALGELQLRGSRGVLVRQVAVGLLTGLSTGLALAGIAWLWERNLVLSGILLLAQTCNLALAGLFGVSVPLILRRFRLDPALGSSIVVTTATDVGGFLIFLGTASALIRFLI